MCQSRGQQNGTPEPSGGARSQHLQPEADLAESDAGQAVSGVREEGAYQADGGGHGGAGHGGQQEADTSPATAGQISLQRGAQSREGRNRQPQEQLQRQ